MRRNRKLVVTEAGLGLTLITCVLVAIGYFFVQRLSGSGQAPPVEIRLSQPDEQPGASPPPWPPAATDQPRVLIAERPDAADAHAPSPTQRPLWLHYEDGDADTAMPGASELTPLAPDAIDSLWRPLDAGRDGKLPEPTHVR